MKARPGRCAFCTNTNFTFLGSPSSLLPFHMQHSLVQALHRAICSSEFAQISIHGPIRCWRRLRSLEARSGRCAFCTYSRFTFLGSPSHNFLLLCTFRLRKHCTGRYVAPNLPKFPFTALYGAAGRGAVGIPYPVGALLPPILGLHF